MNSLTMNLNSLKVNKKNDEIKKIDKDNEFRIRIIEAVKKL